MTSASRILIKYRNTHKKRQLSAYFVLTNQDNRPFTSSKLVHQQIRSISFSLQQKCKSERITETRTSDSAEFMKEVYIREIHFKTCLHAVKKNM